MKDRYIPIGYVIIASMLCDGEPRSVILIFIFGMIIWGILELAPVVYELVDIWKQQSANIQFFRDVSKNNKTKSK